MLPSLMLMPQVRRMAQGGQEVQPIAINLLEAELQADHVSLRRLPRAAQRLSDAILPFEYSEKEKLHEYVEQGMSCDAIIVSFVRNNGGEVRAAAPIDKGFNRLARLFPYPGRAGSAVVIGFAALRFSRRPPCTSRWRPRIRHSRNVSTMSSAI